MTSNKANLYDRISWIVVLLSGAALGIKSLKEPDLWWQLRTGQWMVDNMTVTRVDVFSLSHPGVEWINVKWLFEVLQYLFYGIGGPEFLLFMQVLVNAGLLLVLLSATKKLASLLSDSQVVSKTLFSVVAIAALVAINFRMLGRPEMISHLMTAVFLLILVRHRLNPGKSIYWLILFMTLWANLHEAFGVGMVLIGVFLAANLLEWWIDKSKGIDRNLWLAGLGSILAVSLNPRGPVMILHPLNIFSQVGENKFTTELYDISTPYYWQQYEPYIAVWWLGILLIGFVILMRKQGGWKKLLLKIGIGYMLMLFLFAYLATTAHRNLPFFFIWSVPLAYHALVVIFGLFEGRQWAGRLVQPSRILILVVALGFYISIVSNVFYKYMSPRESYGMGISAMFNPVGASHYLKQEKASDKTIFTDYLASSYLLWDLRPDYKAYIDFRDLDIYPVEFFKAFNQMAAYPKDFEKYDKEYQFKYVVLNRLFLGALHGYLMDSPSWTLQYADAVAVVYKRSQGEPAPFSAPKSLEASGLSMVINFIFNPFYDSSEDLPNPNRTASEYYASIGRTEEAYREAKAAMRSDASDPLNMSQYVYAAINRANASQDPKYRSEILKAAFDVMNTFKNMEDRVLYFRSLGQLYLTAGDPGSALVSFKKANKVEPSKDNYMLMAQCQNVLMANDPDNQLFYSNKWFEFMKSAHELDPHDAILNFNLGVSYCNSNDCTQAIPYLEKATFSGQFSPQEIQTLLDCKKRCGVAIN